MILYLLVCTVVLSYALGSIPWGWVVARLKGIDIRRYGSGNIGATNVLRTLGTPWGITVFVLDAAKGLVAVRVGTTLASRSIHAASYVEVCAIAAAAACVIGHSFPVWLKFKGGKGVATSAGALCGIVPLAVLTVAIVWIVVFQTTRYVSLASITAALSLPVAVAVLACLHMTRGFLAFYICSAMALLVVVRHRSNISRLLSGSEPRFKR